MDKALIEAGVARGDYQAIKLKLRELKFHTLLVKGAHVPIRFKCQHRHEWQATPMQAINDGCPRCSLTNSIKNDPPPVVSFKEFERGVAKQQKFLKQVLTTAKRRLINAKSRSPDRPMGAI